MTCTTETIAKLNNAFRSSLKTGQPKGKIILTQGILNTFSITGQMNVVLEVEEYKDFTQDNDPHGEKDFGSFECAGEKIFWKIDYYDKSLEFGSEDPTDPKKTIRVLTIMLAEEY